MKCGRMSHPRGRLPLALWHSMIAAMELAAAKLPIKTRFVVRERQLG